MNAFMLLLVSSLFATAMCFTPATSHNGDAQTRMCPQGDYLRSLERMSPEKNNSLEGIEQSLSESNGEPTPIGGDPYAPGVAEAYGLIDSTGTDGFDSSADAVGPGIYGGSVKRDPATGAILIGTQYENHNHKPSPLYDGRGYSITSRAIHAGDKGKAQLQRLINDYPQLIEEVSTGGARPLHVCGMSPAGQQCTQILIDVGANVYAVDTYGYNALHRMASNDLEVGAEALVMAGLDPNEKVEEADSTPIEIAKRQRAIKFLMAMQRLGHYD